MKRAVLTRDLIPVNEFRASLAKCLGELDPDGRPLVITQRGRAAAVVVHPAVLDELEEHKDLVNTVLRGLREVARGDLVDDDEVWADIDAMLNNGGPSDEDEVDAQRAG